MHVGVRTLVKAEVVQVVDSIYERLRLTSFQSSIQEAPTPLIVRMNTSGSADDDDTTLYAWCNRLHSFAQAQSAIFTSTFRRSFGL